MQRGRIRLLRHWTTRDSGMTLATMLLVSIFCASSAMPAAARPQNAPQAAPTTKPETAATPDQATPPPEQNPSTPSQAPPSATAPAKTSAGTTSAHDCQAATAPQEKSASSQLQQHAGGRGPDCRWIEANASRSRGDGNCSGIIECSRELSSVQSYRAPGRNLRTEHSVGRRRRRPNVPRTRHCQPNAGDHGSESQEDRRASAQPQPAGHGESSSPVHGAIEGGS